MSIVTRTGDRGSTMVGNERVMKSDSRLELIGSLEELGAWLGKISNNMEQLPDRNMVYSIQLFLYDVIMLINGKINRDSSIELISRIDQNIFVKENKLPRAHVDALHLLPIDATDIHITRAVARRCERLMVAMFGDKYSNVQKIFNRIGSWLYLVARSQTRIPTWVNIDSKGQHQILK